MTEAASQQVPTRTRLRDWLGRGLLCRRFSDGGDPQKFRQARDDRHLGDPAARTFFSKLAGHFLAGVTLDIIRFPVNSKPGEVDPM